MVKANLRVSKGKTLNLGNYESARLDFSIELLEIEDTIEELPNTLYKNKEALLAMLNNWIKSEEWNQLFRQ